VIVYLNGQYLPLEDARISVEDRGFLFADGIYEVIRVYQGRPAFMVEHLDRLAAGLHSLRIEPAGTEAIESIASRLLDENGLRQGDATIYIQVTRGVAPRKHPFPPEGTPATVYVVARAYTPYPETNFRDGVPAVTYPDNRWGRCDIKTVGLLGNVLANQFAREQNAFEAIFVKDGVAIEASHSNLLAVIDGTVVTYPKCNYILPGITRDRILALATDLGFPVREGPIFLDALFRADEVFVSGTTTEVMPITSIDGRRIGNGAPGPITMKLQQAYRQSA